MRLLVLLLRHRSRVTWDWEDRTLNLGVHSEGIKNRRVQLHEYRLNRGQ